MYTVTLDIIPSLKHGYSHKEISKGNRLTMNWKQSIPIIINISDFLNVDSKHICGDRNLQFIFPIRGYPRIVY